MSTPHQRPPARAERIGDERPAKEPEHEAHSPGEHELAGNRKSTQGGRSLLVQVFALEVAWLALLTTGAWYLTSL